MGLDLIPAGKLERMKIFGYADADMREEVAPNIEVLINPESYTWDYRLRFAQEQGQGTSAAHLRYEATEPFELSFEFLFDASGIIDGNPRPNIVEDIANFKNVVLEYKGGSHQPPYVKLVWGAETGFLKGRLTSMSISYKLFSADGSPIRAIIRATFKESTSDEERVARQNNSSPDLTHLRTVKADDTLPMMCKRIYGDPKYYLQVAQFNRLGNFRQLTPGMEIIFPPIKKPA